MTTLPCHSPSKILSLAVALITAVTFQAQALFLRPELEEVPIQRLITNIQAKIEKAPTDAEGHHQLARVHAMAYSRNLTATSKVKAQEREGEVTPWFGHVPPHVPYAKPTSSRNQKPEEKKHAEARKHLGQAMAAYEKSLSLKPQNPTIVRLGLAWCLKEADQSQEAKTAFRQVIREAWKEDQKATLGGMRNFVTAEAIGYLLPLLDAKADAQEMADLTARKEKLESLPRPITPLAVPLRDGLTAEAMIDAHASVSFDLDASGFQNRSWQWLQSDAAAWLVHDPHHRGQITSAIQMFGNRSFNLFFEHGYDALELLDDNRDGALREEELRGLALWHDANGNGQSEAGEVTALAHHDIVGLSCTSKLDASNVRFSPKGVEFEDGSTRPSYDLVLESR